MDADVYKIFGALGSPYSMKVRALMRYRRIPHIWITGPKARETQANVKVPVIPVVQFPDGSWHNDSTPVVFALEERHEGRSAVPDDEADAFLAFLLEDMADEWGTKLMFHYRWFRERDQEQMSRWLAFDGLMGEGREKIEQAAALFRDRQVGRMALVGCTAENQPLIEESGRRIFTLLDDHVSGTAPYLFGSRPSIADFSWMGQFSQLAVDPTPQERMRAEAPYLFRWLMALDDAAGVEGEWRAQAPDVYPSVYGLLQLAGEIYLPFLVANAAALEKGEETFRFDALGMGYEQGTFKYQARCLSALRDAYARLSDGAKEKLDPLLGETGCLNVISGD